jgi:hypothetical protein
MLITLGLDSAVSIGFTHVLLFVFFSIANRNCRDIHLTLPFSQFGGLESPLTGLRDQFYKVFRHRWAREVLTLIIVVSAFLFSIPCMTAVSILHLYHLVTYTHVHHMNSRVWNKYDS